MCDINKNNEVFSYQINPGAKNEKRGFKENDNWKHKSDNMICKTCMYYMKKHICLETSIEVGRCKRNAPSNIGFPVVFPSDWCGEHKIDHEKLLCG